MSPLLMHRAGNASYPGFIAPPPGVTPNLNWEPNVTNFVVQGLCIGLTTLFVVTRMCIKWFLMKQIHLDDYVCVLAWIGSILYSSIILSQGILGLGISQWNLTTEVALATLKRGYVSQILYGPIAFVTKLAILLLLIRIFSVERRFVLFARGLICVCAAYYITITFVQIFICRPIPKAYDPRIPGRCLDTKRIFISNTAIAIVSDVVVLAAPIPVIWKLNMGLWRRLGSIAALAAGGMACLATVARLVVVLKTMHVKDRAKTGPIIVMLSTSEVAIGVICSCLPILPTLFRRMFGNKTPNTTIQTKKSARSQHSSWARRNTIKMHTKIPLSSTGSTRAMPYVADSRNSSQEHLR